MSKQHQSALQVVKTTGTKRIRALARGDGQQGKSRSFDSRFIALIVAISAQSVSCRRLPLSRTRSPPSSDKSNYEGLNGIPIERKHDVSVYVCVHHTLAWYVKIQKEEAVNERDAGVRQTLY